ncbi:hypothetical protein GWI33_007969 [Rhynchophorus ferrugineus]|uniref:Uncharacterized protein n=1 Tax=Rhynchophorus ferrugineus TaxID=354439 RepID=A0A834MHW9_RHYFE|nr:hypothetical protein GWI33_007969 [Rhynchophorus ferrugineus]
MALCFPARAAPKTPRCSVGSRFLFGRTKDSIKMPSPRNPILNTLFDGELSHCLRASCVSSAPNFHRKPKDSLPPSARTTTGSRSPSESHPAHHRRSFANGPRSGGIECLRARHLLRPIIFLGLRCQPLDGTLYFYRAGGYIERTDG